MGKATLFVCVSLIMSYSNAQAQIACRAPESFAEVVICEEDEFKKLDRDLNKKIREIRRDSTEEEDEIFDDEVIDWERNTRDKCTDSTCLRTAYEAYSALLEKKRAALESEIDPITKMRITAEELSAEETRLKGKYVPFMIGYDEDGHLTTITLMDNAMRKVACGRYLEKKTIEFSYRLHTPPLKGSFFEKDGDYLHLVCVRGEFVDARSLTQLQYLSMVTAPTWTPALDFNPPIKKAPDTKGVWSNLTDNEMDNGRNLLFL